MSVWRKVLGRDISENDDSFSSGGNSLLAVRLSAEMQKLGYDSISLCASYLHSTVASLQSYLLESNKVVSPLDSLKNEQK